MNATAFSEPFTPRGVAGFAGAKLWHLLLAQFLFALLAGIVVAWLFHQAYFPAVQKAIESLPADSEIRYGKLDWTGNSFQELAESHFLAMDVDLDHSGQWSAGDLQVEFGRDTIRVFSLFGYADFIYPPQGVLAFNRLQLEPLWSAWRAEILFGIGAATVVSLVVTWWLLATIYFFPVWLIGFFTNRDVSLFGSWKLSGAALLPGALLMTGGIFIYGLGFPLVLLLFFFGAHFVLDWLYLIFGLMFFARTPTAVPRGNPFKPKGKPKA
jgi:hypothetical protein